MPGLDPGVRHSFKMDCRIKFGNDIENAADRAMPERQL
jgi:hypothetical protein